MWIWLGVVFVFFSAPQSKLIGYVLPALVPMAVLAAQAVAPRLSQDGSSLGWFRLSLGAAIGICVFASVGFAVSHPKSSRALAAAMATQFAPGDGVIFVDDYRYDLAFYLRTVLPALVTTDWDPRDVRRHDNWRKELADAGTFDPVLGKERLIDDAGFRQAVCGGRLRWVIAKTEQAKAYSFLAETPPLAKDGGGAVWHLDTNDPRFRSLAGCEPIVSIQRN